MLVCKGVTFLFGGKLNSVGIHCHRGLFAKDFFALANDNLAQRNNVGVQWLVFGCGQSEIVNKVALIVVPLADILKGPLANDWSKCQVLAVLYSSATLGAGKVGFVAHKGGKPAMWANVHCPFDVLGTSFAFEQTSASAVVHVQRVANCFVKLFVRPTFVLVVV